MRPYCGRECPSGPMTWMLCQPAHAISSARRSLLLMRHAPGSRRFTATVRGGSGSPSRTPASTATSSSSVVAPVVSRHSA